MKHFTIIGNWKMHQTPKQAVKLVERLQKKLKPQTHVTTVVCPPFVDLLAVQDIVEPDMIKLGAQNLSDKDEGAITGEVSGPMLAGLVDYVIVGHSERRQYFFETDKQVAQKVAAAVRNKLTPVLCVGEKLNDKHDGHTKRVVVDQLHGGLSQISDDDIHNVIIAYEPVWAIGTGVAATPDDVVPVVRTIRHTIEEMFGEAASSRLKILYGGGTNPDNAGAYLKIEHIDGLLVGGASLNYEQFAKMVNIAAELSTN